MKRTPALALVLLLGCGPATPAWEWRLPANFPTPAVPAENAMSVAKVELGRRLFFDPQLSFNQTTSCGSCHQQHLAFSDGRIGAVGSTGQTHRRNSMALLNVGFFTTLTWANPLITTLEEQALLPLFGETPVELGWAGQETALLARLSGSADYSKRFALAFPSERTPVTVLNITRALAAYQRQLLSGGSAYDRYRAGDVSALSPAAKQGLDLFFSERLECTHCHGGFNFADSVAHDGTVNREFLFHNTGLYNQDGLGAYPTSDRGVIELTLKASDMGRYRTPSLRNIALTAPYMHDGSVATLSEALDHYAVGGRASRQAGGPSPLQSEFVRGFTLTAEERVALLEFLNALTDVDFVNDAKQADPFATP